MKRKTILVLAGLLILAMPLLARMDTPVQVVPQSQNRLLTEVTDEAADWWMIWWVDAGNLSDFTISNTLQGGTFARHPNDEHEFRGELPLSSMYSGNRGDCSEYPKGSNQFYTYAWGLWVGSHYQVKPGEYVYNVSKGAFTSDIGAMAAPDMKEAGGMHNISGLGMYFSDMTIPEGFGYDGEGGRLFPTTGATPMEYQVYWPFTDSADINPRRRAIGMPEVSPEVGDIISMQDTYACGGDWIPMSDARCIWILSTGAYDVRGQGLRIEQRTYAWNYEYNDSYIFINYKIRNMNDFTLDSVYFSFFMDNDIAGVSSGSSPGDEGYWDDLIGFDEELNMGYTYDANGSETGWVTPAGYIGAIFLDTPNDIGLSGFETWPQRHVIDDLGQDSVKYAYMASADYITWDNPNDVRMLMNSGPYMELAPDEEVNLTIAVIVAYSYDELREKAMAAKIQFDNGYFGYSPPPNPSLAVVPGDSVVFLTWGSESENYVDPMSGLATFEGYRVYKSLSGLTDTWQLLADYDLVDSENPDTAVVEHTSGPSKASIKYLSVYWNEFVPTEPSEYGFEKNAYTLTFQEDADYSYYIVYDVAEQKQLTYNSEALTEGGYCILDAINGGAIQLDDAIAATGTVTFTGQAGDSIPKGTIAATDVDDAVHGYVEFQTQAAAVIDSGETTVDANVQASIPGEIGNVWTGAITTIVSSDVPPGLTVTNNASITGGVDGVTHYPYNPGDIIFIDGGQYTIEAPADTQPGDIVDPIPGEVFTIYSYPGAALSNQAGLRHYYIDEDVHNGQIYYYSVTAYSRSQPTEGVDELEGGKTGKTYWAVPRTNPAGWENAWASPAERIAGDGSALVVDSVISPDEVTGHTYEVGFRAVERIDTIIDGSDVTIDTMDVIKYAYFEDTDSGYVVLDSFPVHAGEFSGPVIDGVFVQVAAVSMDTLDIETQIDSLQTGWLVRQTGTDFNVRVEWDNTIQVPITKDFLVDIVESAMDDHPTRPTKCLVDVSVYDSPSETAELLWRGADSSIVDDAKFEIWYPRVDFNHLEYKKFRVIFNDTITEIQKITHVDSSQTPYDTTYTEDTLALVTWPEPGDQWLLKTLKSTTEEDLFRYETYAVGLTEENIEDELNKIRVVPNPYYVRAPWDLDQHSRHVMFQDLPMKCTIRIFNSAGLLIRTIEHDGEGLYGAAGSAEWNLLTEGGMDCTSGLYIWQVQTETTDGKKYTKVGKFAIIR